MSTRGLVGFRFKGKDYLQYNHSDSYPSGLGKELLQDVQEMLKETVLAVGNYLKQVSPVDGDHSPSVIKLSCLAKTHPLLARKHEEATAAGKVMTWYELLRGYQGNLGRQVMEGMPYYIDYDGFQFSAMCAWVYVVNLDEEIVEIYSGVGKARTMERAGRFWNDAGAGTTVNLLETISFVRLRKFSPEDIATLCEQLEQRVDEED